MSLYRCSRCHVCHCTGVLGACVSLYRCSRCHVCHCTGVLGVMCVTVQVF